MFTLIPTNGNFQNNRGFLDLESQGPDIVATVALAPKKAFLHLLQTLLSSGDSFSAPNLLERFACLI